MLRITKCDGMVIPLPGVTPYEVVVLVVVVLITFRLAVTGVVRPLSVLGKSHAEVVTKIQPRGNFDKIQSRQLAKITNRIGVAQSTGAETIAKIQPRANVSKIQSRQLAKIINRTDQQQAAGTLLAAAFKRGGNFAKI